MLQDTSKVMTQMLSAVATALVMTASVFAGGLGSDCPGDLNHDGQVDSVDLAEILGAWGPNTGHRADLNGDGLVGPLDLAPLLSGWGPCPQSEACQVLCANLEVVLIMDTSASMVDEAQSLCDGMPAMLAEVEDALNAMSDTPVSGAVAMLGITEDAVDDPSLECVNGSVLESLTAVVPGDNGTCPAQLDQGADAVAESKNWGSAAAIVAQEYNWLSGATRIMIPVSDGGACMGGTQAADACDAADVQAADHAAQLAAANNVVMLPIIASHPGQPVCLYEIAEQCAGNTGGTALLTSDAQSDLVDAIIEIAMASCQTTCGD